MKRAIGLILAVLAFAVVAHADRIEYGGWDYAAGAGADLRSRALSAEALQSSNLLMEPGSIAFGTGGTFSESGDDERLTDYVFYSHFGDSEKVVEGPVEFDSIRRRLDGFLDTRDDEQGRHFGIEHRDPIRRVLGVLVVPEPGTLLMPGVGLAALAIWKRRTSMSEQPFVRFF